jgi:hypothetical protein
LIALLPGSIFTDTLEVDVKKVRIAVLLLLGIILVTGLACGGGTTTWQLSTVLEGQGTVSPSGGTFSDGDEITITALPVSGWSFDHWGGHISGSGNPITVTINSDKTIYAYFIPGIAPTLTPEPTPLPTCEAGVICITASKLCSDYNDNELAADNDYKGKILDLSSRIEDIDREPLSDRAYLTMDCGIITDVWCYFDAAYESELDPFQKGDYVTVRGTCSGKDMFERISLEHCTSIQGATR